MSFQSHIALAKTDLLAQVEWIDEQRIRLLNEFEDERDMTLSDADRLNELHEKKQAASRWLECLEGILREIQNK